MKTVSIMLVALAAILPGTTAQAAGEYVDHWNQPEKKVAREKPIEDWSDRFPVVCIHGYTFYRVYEGSFPQPFPSAEKQEKCK